MPEMPWTFTAPGVLIKVYCYLSGVLSKNKVKKKHVSGKDPEKLITYSLHCKENS